MSSVFLRNFVSKRVRHHQQKTYSSRSIFKKEAFDLLNKYDYNDFGKQIIPAAISNYRVFAYPSMAIGKISEQ